MNKKANINDIQTNVVVDWKHAMEPPKGRLEYYFISIPIKDYKFLEIYVPHITCKSHVDIPIRALSSIKENLRDKPKRIYKKRENNNE